MSGSKSLLLYQDEPSGFLLRLILMIIPLALLVGSGFLWSSGGSAGGPFMIVAAVVLAVFIWMIVPRKYQVYEDHLRIVLGGPFGVNVRFDRIKDVEKTNRTSMTLNFITTIARSYVIIVEKRGMSIAITPKASDLFVENANRALDEWARSRGVPRSA